MPAFDVGYFDNVNDPKLRHDVNDPNLRHDVNFDVLSLYIR